MKKAILILVALALQVLYYLSKFGVVEVNILSNSWLRFLVITTFCLAAYIVVGSDTTPVRKWIFSVSYLLSLLCAVAAYLNLAGVYLGPYTYAVLFNTVLPLSYGTYLRCSMMTVSKREEAFPYSSNFFEPAEPQEAYTPVFIDCTREEMLAELPHSAKLSNEKLFEIKEQLVDGLHELNVEVERVKMDIGERSLTCQLRYDTIPSAIRASGFPCNINIFYRLLSIDRDEKIMTIDIPYKKQVA